MTEKNFPSDEKKYRGPQNIEEFCAFINDYCLAHEITPQEMLQLVKEEQRKRDLEMSLTTIFDMVDLNGGMKRKEYDFTTTNPVEINPQMSDQVFTGEVNSELEILYDFKKNN